MFRPPARFAATLGAAALLLSGFTAGAATAAVSPQKDLGLVEVSPGISKTLTGVAVNDQFKIANQGPDATVTLGTGLVRNDSQDVCDTSGLCLLAAGATQPFYVVQQGTITIQYTDGTTATIDLKATLPTPALAVTNWNPSTLEAKFDWAPYDWQGLTPYTFTVEKQLSGGAWETIPNAAWPLQTYALATVLPAQTWNFRVKAIAQDGTESAWGETTYTVPALSLPLTITAGDASGTFTWDKLPATATYEIYVYSTAFQPTVRVTCSTPQCSYAMTGLTNGTRYTGYVKALAPDNTGRLIAQSSDVAFTPAAPTLPKPSVSVIWFGDTGTRASLDFAPYDWGTFTPQGFEIGWTTDGVTWNNVDNSATPLKEDNVYIDGVGPAGQDAAFDVRAIAADGTKSEYGRVRSMVPQPFTATATGGDQSISGSFTAYPRTGITYSVVVQEKGKPQTAIIQTFGAPGPFTFTGLTNGAAYEVYVNAGGYGSTAKVTVTPRDRKVAQPNPTATWDPAKGTIVTWPWSDSDWGTTGKGLFSVSYVDDSKTTTLTTDKPTIIIAAGVLRRNVAHFIAVVAVGADGTRSNAGQTSITPPFTDAVLSAAAGDGSITASFPWVPGMVRASLRYGPEGTSDRTTVTVPCTSAGVCTQTLTGLINGTKYELNISAIYDASSRIIGYSNYVYPTPQALPSPLDLVYPVKADLHVGQPLAINPTAAGGTTPYAYREGSTALPKGLALNATTGVISGTPEVAVDGLYPIVISDQSGQSLTAPLRLVIAAHTLTLSYPDHAGHVGTPFTLTPSVSHALGAVTYVLEKGKLPAGMSLDKATGVISGTPTVPTSGPVALTVKATDSYASTSAAFTLTVDSGAATLSASYPNATGHVGKSQIITPTVSGATGTPTFALTAGTLPAGLSLDPATGIIAGTPTLAQAATPVTVKVSDGAASVDITFTIGELEHTLTLAYPSSTGDVGVTTSISPVVSHSIGTVTYSLTSGTLPAGLALAPTTGVISGTPTATTSGPVALTVTATDSYGSASAAFTLTVTDVSPPVPTIGVTMTRDVDRLFASGTVVGAPAGTAVTPWVKLSGQSGFVAGSPVSTDASGGFLWSRLVDLTKVVRVYFVVAGVQSATLVGQAPQAKVVGSRQGRSLLASGMTSNIAPGSTVQPWIRINGQKAVKGTPLQVDQQGRFAWTDYSRRGDRVRVWFTIRGVRTNTIDFSSLLPTIMITGQRDPGSGARQVRVTGSSTGLDGKHVKPFYRYAGQDSFTAGNNVRRTSSTGDFTWKRRTAKKMYVYFKAEGVRSNVIVIAKQP